jgi:hypothetical protein
MQKLISTKALYFFRGALHYKWTAMVISGFLCLSGWAFVSAIPNKYTSEVNVQIIDLNTIEPTCINVPVSKRNFYCIRKLVQQVSRRMFTNENLEQIIKLSDLEKVDKGKNEHEALIANLKKDIHSTLGADETFVISYENISPVLAQSVIQALLTVFSEKIQYDEEKTIKFVEAQINDYQAQFKFTVKPKATLQKELLLEEQVPEAQKQLVTAKLQLTQRTSFRKQTLRYQLGKALTENDSNFLDVNQSLPKEDEQKEAARKQLIRYNVAKALVENDTNLLGVKESTSELIEFINEINEYFKTSKIEISKEIEHEQSAQKRVDELEQFIKKNSKYERRLDNPQDIFNDLLRERERLQLSIKKSMGSLQFKIIDAPTIHLQSSFHDRKLLFSGVFIGSILVGLASAFLRFQRSNLLN